MTVIRSVGWLESVRRSYARGHDVNHKYLGIAPRTTTLLR